MSGQNSPNDDYTFEEVMKILGKKKSTLYREIEEGKIPFYLPAEKKIGMRFPKEGIDILAKRERKEKAEKQAIHLKFEPSTTADLWSAIDNALKLYGPGDVISFERALEWRDSNPDISMSVKQGKLLAGMVTYLPLDEEIILALLQDKMRERDIPDQAIRQWTDPQISVYVAGIATIPSGKRPVDSLHGRFLLRHAIKWAITLTAQYDIKNWYGIGVTQEGQDILNALGFREILSLENGKRKGYVLNSTTMQLTKLVQRYLRNMESQDKLES
jgi:predicted DNA-binding transcriptional regulator AlpA